MLLQMVSNRSTTSEDSHAGTQELAVDSLVFSLAFVPLDPPTRRQAGVVVFPGLSHLADDVEAVPHQLNILLAEEPWIFEAMCQPRPSALQLDPLGRLQECDGVPVRAVHQPDLPAAWQAGVPQHPVVITNPLFSTLSRPSQAGFHKIKVALRRPLLLKGFQHSRSARMKHTSWASESLSPSSA